MMPAASHQRTVGISVALGVLAVALSGCGNVTGVGTGASAGHGGGGASQVDRQARPDGRHDRRGRVDGRYQRRCGIRWRDGHRWQRRDGRRRHGRLGIRRPRRRCGRGRRRRRRAGDGGDDGWRRWRRGARRNDGCRRRRGTRRHDRSGGWRRRGTRRQGGGAAGGAVGTGGTGVCAILCTVGRTCCGGGCVNPQNDPFNCGKCANVCPASAPFCDNGTCGRPPCEANVICIGTATCCGNMCCGVGQLCCEEQGPVSRAPVCFTPTADSTDLHAGLRARVPERSQPEEGHRAGRHQGDPGQGRPPANLDLDLRRGAERRPPPGTDGAGFPRQLRPRQRRSDLQLRRRPRRRAGRDPGPRTHGRGAGKAHREARARKPPARTAAAPERSRPSAR